MSDNVNHPRHYTSHPSGIEPIDIVRHMNFNLGNVVKYIFRADFKGGLEDLKKAAWYLSDEIKRREGTVSTSLPEKCAATTGDAPAGILVPLPNEEQTLKAGRFSEDEMETIRELAREGKSVECIALFLGRTEQSVRDKYYKLRKEDALPAPAVKQQKIEVPAKPVYAPASKPFEPMKLKSVKAKTGWGHNEHEVLVAEPNGSYIDKATGKKVTTYPAGFAQGVTAQHNVSVKGD